MPSSYAFNPSSAVGTSRTRAAVSASSRQPQMVTSSNSGSSAKKSQQLQLQLQRSNSANSSSRGSGYSSTRQQVESRQSNTSASAGRHLRSTPHQLQQPQRRGYSDSAASDGGSSISIQSSPGGGGVRQSASHHSRSKTEENVGFRADSPVARMSEHSAATTPRMNSRPADKIASVKQAISALNKSLGSDKRISVITHACAEFDHWDEQKHNMELQYGAANVLTLILSMTEDDDEIRMLCAALEMVFRSSQVSVQQAYNKVSSNLLPILLTLTEQCESNTLKHSDVTLLNITKTLFYMSRVSDLRVHLFRQRGMVELLKRVASSKVSVDCRVARMRLFANLANCDNNKLAMMQNTALIETVLRIAALDTSEVAREYAAVTLMDLASYEDNHVKMADMDKLLGTLVKLAVLEQVAETREAAVSALQNLAFCKNNRVRLVSYGNGVVLEALKKTVGTDTNDKTRRRAAGALTNLACDETAERMGCHKGLLETLAVVSTKDNNADVQSRASMALNKIAGSITVNMPCHTTLLDALVVTGMSAHAKSGLSSVLRVKAREQENRESMAHHPGILDTILDMCSASTKNLTDRHNAMRALMHLTNEPANVKLLCSKTVLNVLVQGASMDYDKTHEIPQSAITALERLATDFNNRPYMARHEGLLVAVAKATEREAKLESRGGMMMSSASSMIAGQQQDSSTNQFLAKPLLLSLLVAM